MTTPADIDTAVPADLADLEALLAAAQQKLVRVSLNDGESKRAKLLAEIEEAESSTRVAEKTRRGIAGKALEASARRAANALPMAARYSVEFYDLAEKVLRVDPDTLPGKGVLVVRSPPTTPVDVLAEFYAALEAGSSTSEAYINLASACVVHPVCIDPAGAATAEGQVLRTFLESSVGRGAAQGVGDAAAALGGVRAAKVKRGR